MQLTGLVDLLQQTNQYQKALSMLETQTSLTLNIIRSARPYLTAALAQDWPGPIIYVTARIKRAYNVAEQLPVWLGDHGETHAPIPVLRYEEPSSYFYERVPWTEGVIRSRLEALNALMAPADEGGKSIIVASARALMQRTMPVNHFRRSTMRIEAGNRWQIDHLLSAWTKMGYEPSSL
jgi:transcription-repair coupling factor (superfamily II helicase)